jgi:signal peptidase I
MMSTWIADTADELIDARLRMGNVVRFTVPTRNMYPALAPGDQVIVRGISAAEVRVGDIVVMSAGQARNGTATTWLAHRLIERRAANGSASLVTKGDNSDVADAPWTEAQLVGSVVAVQWKRAAQPVDFTSRRARGVNALLARFSRGQWFVQRALREPCPERKSALSMSQGRRVARGIAVRASRMLFRAGGVAARWIVG